MTTTEDAGATPEVPATAPEPKAKKSAPAFDPTKEYGDFEGKPVVGIVTKINGTSSRISRPIHPGEEGWSLVHWKHGETAHKTTKEGWKRHQTLGTDDVYELSPEQGAALETECRAALAAEGRLDGQLRITDQTPTVDVVVDGSGVVLTGKERAEKMGVSNGEPFLGFDQLTANKAVEAIAAIDSVDQANTIMSYEARSRKRSSVIKAAKERAAELEAAEPR